MSAVICELVRGLVYRNFSCLVLVSESSAISQVNQIYSDHNNAGKCVCGHNHVPMDCSDVIV